MGIPMEDALADEIMDLKAENERLRTALEEIANHYIDSELASQEKRRMAIRAVEHS